MMSAYIPYGIIRIHTIYTWHYTKNVSKLYVLICRVLCYVWTQIGAVWSRACRTKIIEEEKKKNNEKNRLKKKAKRRT